MRRMARAGRGGTRRRRNPPRHLARPGPATADARRGTLLLLWMIALLAFFMNVAESGLAEIVYPAPVMGFLRIERTEPDAYRLTLVGRRYYLNPSHVLASVNGFAARLGSSIRHGSGNGPVNTLLRDD